MAQKAAWHETIDALCGKARSEPDLLFPGEGMDGEEAGEEVRDILRDVFASMIEYEDIVLSMTMRTPAYFAGSLDRDAYQRIDRTRTRCHDGAISNIAMLNRLCQKAGIPVFCSLPTDSEKTHRRNVGTFVGDFLDGVYQDAAGTSDDGRSGGLQERWGELLGAAGKDADAAGRILQDGDILQKLFLDTIRCAAADRLNGSSNPLPETLEAEEAARRLDELCRQYRTPVLAESFSKGEIRNFAGAFFPELFRGRP